jgi:hypothetical protein
LWLGKQSSPKLTFNWTTFWGQIKHSTGPPYGGRSIQLLRNPS